MPDDDVIVVEANAQVGLRTAEGKPIQVTGTFAVSRNLINRTLAAVPDRLVRALDRPPTEEEIRRSVRRGLVLGIGLRIPVGGPGRPHPTVSETEGDARPLMQLRKADLENGAVLLGLDASGTRSDLIARIEGEAARVNVDTAGPGLDAIQRIFEAAQAEVPGRRPA